MTDIQQTWQQHAEPFTAVVESVRDWDAPSPCDGWTARDVLTHVIDTERDFLAKQGHDLPESDSGEPAAAWVAHDEAVRQLLSDPAVAAQEYDGVFGRTTVGESLVQFYGFDLLVHRWDLARSQGDDERFSDAELDEIEAAVEGFGEHAYDPGVFKRPVEVPREADRQAQVLARTGRGA